MKEEWRDIKGFEGLYQINNYGKVKSLERYSMQNHLISEKLLTPHYSQGGYLDYSLYKDGIRYHKKPHRLVAEAFIPNPNNLPEVDHIDTDKNNNRVDNLRWVTHSENHLNPLTVQLKKEKLTGRKIDPKVVAKREIKITVLKDNIPIYTFKSYREMDEKSKDIFGVTLWNVYARKVVNGKIPDYHGYTFRIN